MRNRHRASGLNLFCFWAGVLLVLPACGLDSSGAPGPPPEYNVDKGDPAYGGAVFCVYEKPDGRRCATPEEIADGIFEKHLRFSDAAIAVLGCGYAVGLDDTDAGKANCGGNPQLVYFETGTDSSFPCGIPICFNCSQIASLADALAACRTACYDTHGTWKNDVFYPTVPPHPDVKSSCDARTHVATNGVSVTNGTDVGCYASVCTQGFVAPIPVTRLPEAVFWTNFLGGAQTGGAAGDLTRATGNSTTTYDAGAVSKQWIWWGTAYVEFSANSSSQSHVLGLSHVPEGCTHPDDCPDTDAGVASIGFAIKLHSDGNYYILEKGQQIAGPFDDAFGGYTPEKRFRIKLLYAGEGKARVQFVWMGTGCSPGDDCYENFIYESATLASYPVRVDASLMQNGATLTNVHLVRIQHQQ